LPTEAQWEYACRAGATTLWYCGDGEATLREHAWFTASSEGKLHSIGQLAPNAWGLYDMHGNVWESCLDRWRLNYYESSSFEDPTGPSEGSNRVLRGGSWTSDASLCRASHRLWDPPVQRHRDRGFRIVKPVSYPPP
jgi:formylglycine-generating enzyme required for sulfatase activity